MVAAALGSAASGFALAQWRTVSVAAPVLQERVGPQTIVGRTVRFERFPDGARVTLDRLRPSRLPPDRTPEKVRLRLRGSQPTVRAGDWVRLRAVLSPPPEPAMPGAFDFQRQSYFRRLGAVGFAMGRIVVIAAGDPGLASEPGLALARFRESMADRVMAAVGGDAGAVAAALMTGERQAIPERTMTAIRDAGLAHLLAISGLHIGLIAGILFFAIRGALALNPGIALRFPIKKWAAAAALAGALCYALLVGATVPTQRAFLMIGAVLLAILLDREGISMRTLAWAAIVVLALQPESLLGASFQMSFAAVTALVAVYEIGRKRPWRRRVWWRRPVFYFGAVAVATVVAGAATAPFALYHFNRVTAYSLAANLVAVPITALWVMPCAVIAFVLMPFGLDGVALEPMRWGIVAVLDTAEKIAAWPGAVHVVPAMPAGGLITVALGGAWLCLWRRRWRWLGLVGIAAGLSTTLLTVPPDVLVDGRGRLMAARTEHGYAVSSLRAGAFTRETWSRRAGFEAAAISHWPEARDGTRDGLRCDLLGCIYEAGGETVALVRDPLALSDDCRRASVVISAVPVRVHCPAARMVIDRFDLWREGAHAIWLSDEGVKVVSVADRRGDRPWVIRRGAEAREPGA
jgi:competence protein ComEC